jgi:integrase
MCLYLTKRGSTYYFRRAIPDELWPAFGGKRELTFSLKTKDKEEAKRRRSVEALRTDGLLESARAHLGLHAAPVEAQRPHARPISPAEIEQAEREGHELSEKEHRREELSEWTDFLERRLKGSTAQMPRHLRAFRYLIERGEFKTTLLQDQLTAARAEIAQLKQGHSPAPSQALAEAPQSAASVPAGQTPGTMMDPTVVDLWAAERKPQPQGEQMYRAAVRWFEERVGKKPVNEYTKADAVRFKTKLVEEGHTSSNIKNKISRLRTLFQFAADNGEADGNPFDGVTIRDATAAKNKRRSFDLASLNALFGSPLYSDRQLPGDSRAAGVAAYWIPLLALFTGARREELGQLRPEDVVNLTYPDEHGEERSAWFLKLLETDDEEGAVTKLKNAASERLVPVHPELERLGFVAFAQAARDKRQKRLFPALKVNTFGRLTDKWGQWFTAYRRSVGVTDKRMVFHSFRHTFHDYMRNAGIAEGVQRQIVGHRGDDVHDDYGSGYSLHRLVEAMKLYKVPGLKLPQTKVR